MSNIVFKPCQIAKRTPSRNELHKQNIELKNALISSCLHLEMSNLFMPEYCRTVIEGQTGFKWEDIKADYISQLREHFIDDVVSFEVDCSENIT